MKLDYSGPINEYGDNFVRLFDFGIDEAILFHNLLSETLLVEETHLNLDDVDFIELRNCNLILRLCDTDEGIWTDDNENFYCDMTVEGYQQMLKLIKPFCERETKGFQYLYDVDSLCDLLFAPGGTCLDETSE